MEQRYAQYAVEKPSSCLQSTARRALRTKRPEWVLEAFASLGFDARKRSKGGILIDLGGEESAEGGLLLQAHTDTLGAMVAEIKANGGLARDKPRRYARRKRRNGKCARLYALRQGL